MAVQSPYNRYDKGVPRSLRPYPARTLVDMVGKTAREVPESPALFFMGSTLKYCDLERQSDAFAFALVEAGVRKGDRVALLMPNVPQMIVSELGIWKAGAVVVPLNPLYTSQELEFALNESEAEIAVVLALFYGKVKAIQPKTQLRRVIATGIKEYLPPVKKLLFTLMKEKKEGHGVRVESPDLLYSKMIRQNLGKKPSLSLPLPGDTALFLFSGGTTGKPKCAVSSHDSLVMTGMQVSAWFGDVLIKGKDIFILNMPLFHAYAQVGVMATGFVGRHPLALLADPRNMDDLFETIRNLKPALLPGVPTFFNAMLRHATVFGEKSIFGCLKICVSSAGPLTPGIRERIEQLTGGKFINAYSLTEATVATVLEPVLGLKKAGATGVPAPDVVVKILDDQDEKTELQVGETGEVVICAPQLMKGYWGRPEDTAAVLRNGWLYTGDIGYLDNEGYLYIVDRKKDVIKPGGFQVWPSEVERVICSHPYVLDAGVSGVFDDYQGEAVKAWVVLREGRQMTKDELRHWCRKELAVFKVPKAVAFVDELPKSPIGKLLRRKLHSIDEMVSETS